MAAALDTLAKLDASIGVYQRRHRRILKELETCPLHRRQGLLRQLKEASDSLHRLHTHRMSLLIQDPDPS